MSEFIIINRLLKDLKIYRKKVITGLILYLPITLLNVSQPIIMGFAVQNSVINESKNHILIWALFFFVLVLLLVILELWQGVLLQTVGQKLVRDLRQKAFIKNQLLPMAHLDKTPLGKILTNLTNDAEAVSELFSLGAIQIFADILFLFTTFLMLLAVNIKLTIYSLITMPLLLWGLYFFRKHTRKAFFKVRLAISNLNSFLQEYLSGMSVVQIYNQINQSQKKFQIFNQKHRKANRQAVILDAANYSFVDAMSYLATACVLFGAMRLQSEGVLKLGILVAFIQALNRFFQPLREFSNNYSIFQSALVSLQRIYDLLDWPEENISLGNNKTKFNSRIEFINVKFGYRIQEPVLKGVSFSIEKGERIALIGHTGTGKSTIIKLLNRFYNINHGEIVIDKENIKNIKLRDLRSLISSVPQEVFLFTGTLKENLCFGNKNITDEEIWHALKIVQLDNLFRKKSGLTTIIKSKGQNFSQGERQLLAIARALIVNNPILILDEATANVDSITERKLQKAILELMKNRTALIIAHRLSTIKYCDRIILMRQGFIAETGSHKQLVAQNGLYANLIRLQKAEKAETAKIIIKN